MTDFVCIARRSSLNDKEQKGRKGYFNQVEDDERDREDCRYPTTFRFTSVFQWIHLNVGIGLDSNVVD